MQWSVNECVISMAGISRSVAITAMYIMLVTSLDNEQALTIIKHCRPQAGPNLGFRMQLQNYYRKDVEEVCMCLCVCVCVCTCVCMWFVYIIWPCVINEIRDAVLSKQLECLLGSYCLGNE